MHLFRDIRVFLLCCTLLSGVRPNVAYCDNAEENLFNLSLEELLNTKVKVAGAITSMTLAEQPFSITTISSESIAMTPARNLADLMETYVPGVFWMNSEIGPLIGMRGSLVNKNFKYLLLVNGRVMNSKGFFGVKSELEQWDLGDVEQIQIIRGPGAVTYGPGAVSGVINITTKRFNLSNDSSLEIRYNDTYDSKGVSLSNQFETNFANFYSFLSVTRSQGDSAPHFLVNDNDELGFVGRDFDLDKEPLDYFADFLDKPQIKFHLDGQFNNDWRVWFRYTQQGSNWKSNEVKSEFDGELINQQGTRDRQWTLTTEKTFSIRDNLSLTTMLSADSFDAERRIENERGPVPASMLNHKLNYSESEFFARALFNWQLDNDLQNALSFEYSYDEYGPGWNDRPQEFRFGENSDIINGPDSEALEAGNKGSADRNGPPIFAGKGWSTDTFAIVGEMNKSYENNMQLVLSARLDKTANSNWLLSPRIVVSSQFTKGQFLRVIAQRSGRFNNAGQNYAESLTGGAPEQEHLKSIELNYSAFIDENHTIQASFFSNDAEVISWNGELNESLEVGNHRVAGFESEYLYKTTNLTFGINFSTTKQISWDLADGLSRSGISYSDYNQPLDDSNAILTSIGNDINNWPNNALKTFINWQASDQWTLHINAHGLWDFQGAQDGLNGLQLAVAGEPEEPDTLNSLAIVESAGAYDTDIRLNASVNYQFNDHFSINIYAQNLLDSNNNNRYAEDSGNDEVAPRRVRFTVEPRSVGIKFKYRWQ